MGAGIHAGRGKQTDESPKLAFIHPILGHILGFFIPIYINKVYRMNVFEIGFNLLGGRAVKIVRQLGGGTFNACPVFFDVTPLVVRGGGVIQGKQTALVLGNAFANFATIAILAADLIVGYGVVCVINV
jgi:hypothetical protein